MIFAILIICLLVALFLLLEKKRRIVENEPPIEYGWIPWIGCGLSYQRAGYSFLRRMEKKHGSIFTLYMGGRYYTIVTDPQAYGGIAKEVKRLDFHELSSEVTERAFGFRRIPTKSLPHGGFTHNYLQGERLKDMIISTRTNMEQVLTKSKYRKFSDWNKVDLFEFSYEIMFEVVFRTIFGSYHTNEKTKLSAALQQFLFFDDKFIAVAVGTPFSADKDFSDTRKSLWKILGEQNLRSNACEMIQFGNELMRSRDISQSDIDKRALSILWAAQANTAPSCFWALYFLLRDQKALLAVTEEIAMMVQKRGYDSERQLEKEDLAEMTILGSVIKEALRLSTATVSARSLKEDVFVSVKNSPYRIRKGDTLLLPFRLVHMNSELYDDPAAFRYDRYINSEGKEKKEFFMRGQKLNYYFQPFGSEGKLCPGRFWAISQIKQFLISVISCFDFKLVDCELPVQMSKDRFGFGTLHPTVPPSVELRIKNYCK